MQNVFLTYAHHAQKFLLRKVSMRRTFFGAQHSACGENFSTYSACVNCVNFYVVFESCTVGLAEHVECFFNLCSSCTKIFVAEGQHA
jgi:hypothetical protein